MAKRFCTGCGTELDPSWQFCQGCGRPLSDEPSTTASTAATTATTSTTADLGAALTQQFDRLQDLGTRSPMLLVAAGLAIAAGIAHLLAIVPGYIFEWFDSDFSLRSGDIWTGYVVLAVALVAFGVLAVAGPLRLQRVALAALLVPGPIMLVALFGEWVYWNTDLRLGALLDIASALLAVGAAVTAALLLAQGRRPRVAPTTAPVVLALAAVTALAALLTLLGDTMWHRGVADDFDFTVLVGLSGLGVVALLAVIAAAIVLVAERTLHAGIAIGAGAYLLADGVASEGLRLLLGLVAIGLAAALLAQLPATDDLPG